DDIPSVGTWQVELRKVNDDPLDMDEIILHVHNANGLSDEQLRQQLRDHCYRYLEIHPNRIEFHTNEEMRQLQGVGKLLKEQKVVDHRPAAGNGNGDGHVPAVTATSEGASI